jgi:type IV secretory pathway VirB4 component
LQKTTTKQRPLPVKSGKRKRLVPQSAQQTIPYREMMKDGICKVRDGYYTKTIEYEDINYSVASNEDQSAIFDGYCGFLNYFDSTLPFQMSFVNHRSRPGSRYSVNIPPQNDDFNSIRAEYVDMLKGQVARSNNGIIRSKYITFGINADNIGAARPRLERVESDILSNFKKLGVVAYTLNGYKRLEALYGQLHPNGKERFVFSWDDIPKSGLSTKDYIAPSGFDFRQSRFYRVGSQSGAVSYLQILASEMSDKLLLELLELDAEITVTMHIQTVDQIKAIKTIKAKMSDIDKMKIEAQKQAVRAGYDMDILPPDLITFSNDVKTLLADLQSRNERMFLLTFLIMNTAPTRQRLENDIFTVSGIAQKYNCALKRLDFQQEQGYMSSLLLGNNAIEIQRGMTTSSTAIFIPFLTQELRMDGQALYYGMNALSHNVIMANRKRLKSANGLYLGSTGSGKSFSAKRELINVFLISGDMIIVVDPMGEYTPLIRRLGGQVVEVSPNSIHHINPLDIQFSNDSDENPLSLKADFILSLMELIVGGKDGLQPVERTVIDRCVRLLYRDFINDPATAKMPILQDLYELLLEQPEAESKRLATALEIYVSGSLNVFNHRTNVDLDSRLVCLDLKQLGAGLRTIAMLIMQDLVWSRVSKNHTEGKATWCYLDEFHLLLKDELTASYCVTIWKMLRKKGCVPSALTQNVKDLLASREVENILENTDFMVLLSQAQGDRQILAKQLGISEHQLSYITHSNSGEGLLFFGNTTIPFVDRFPRGEIYDLLTTRPEDIRAAANE